MKTLLLTLVALISINVIAQIERVTLSEFKLLSSSQLQCKLTNVIDYDNNDSSKHVSLVFQNFKYQHISDNGVIILPNQEELNSFIKDLSILYSKLNTESNLEFNRENYTVAYYDFAKNKIYILDTDGKYMILNKEQYTKLVNWLNTINF
jgi:hypothetical protein